MWLGGDTYDHYATADLAKKYTIVTGSPTIHAGSGRGGTSSLRVSVLNYNVGMAIAPGNLEIFHALAFRTTLVNTAGLAALYDGVTNAAHLTCVLNIDGSIAVWRHNQARGATGYLDFGLSTLLGVTAPGLISANAWHHLGFHSLIHASAGMVTVYVNGHVELALSGINTKGDQAGLRVTLAVHGGYDNATVDWDDLMIYDSSGAAPTTWLGDLTGEASFVTGAGTTTGWTPSAGSNYQCVDDPTPDGDTTTVSTNTLSAKDTYTHTPLIRVVQDIAVVQSVLTAKKTDSGTRAIAAVTRSGGTDYPGIDHYLNSDYAMHRHGRPVNPNGNIAWTKAAVDASEIGQVVSV